MALTQIKGLYTLLHPTITLTLGAISTVHSVIKPLGMLFQVFLAVFSILCMVSCVVKEDAVSYIKKQILF